MLSVDGEQLEEIIDAIDIEKKGGNAGNELYELAKNWEEEICVCCYDVAISTCKASKGTSKRQSDCDNFYEFSENCRVDVCSINSEFVSFMLRHVRDLSLDLREQLRDLQTRYSNHDYSHTIRN